MLTYTIEYDLTELKNLIDNSVKGMTTAAFPHTDAAFAEAAEYVRSQWLGFLTGSVSLPGVDNPDRSEITSAMVKSIKTKDKTNEAEFYHTVYTDNRQVEELNKGSKAVEYDMKKTHPYGKKSRVTESGKNKGVPYLIIPFRWGTPNGKGTKRAHFNNFIPQKNYNTAVKGLKMSKVNTLKNYFEKNVRGEKIERQGYDWAKFGRLTEEQAWNDRSVGMVRMIDTASKVRKSTYFTFRIISANSKAGTWIYKKDAKKGLNYMAALDMAVKPEINKIIKAGIEADVKDLTGN